MNIENKRMYFWCICVFLGFVVMLFSQTQSTSITIVSINCARADISQFYSVRVYSCRYSYIIPLHESSFLKQLLVEMHLNAPISVCLQGWVNKRTSYKYTYIYIFLQNSKEKVQLLKFYLVTPLLLAF